MLSFMSIIILVLLRGLCLTLDVFGGMVVEQFNILY